jgi:hypothetical protein
LSAIFLCPRMTLKVDRIRKKIREKLTMRFKS